MRPRSWWGTSQRLEVANPNWQRSREERSGGTCVSRSADANLNRRRCSYAFSRVSAADRIDPRSVPHVWGDSNRGSCAPAPTRWQRPTTRSTRQVRLAHAGPCMPNPCLRSAPPYDGQGRGCCRRSSCRHRSGGCRSKACEKRARVGVRWRVAGRRVVYDARDASGDVDTGTSRRWLVPHQLLGHLT